MLDIQFLKQNALVFN